MATKMHLASSGGDIKIWDMPELAMAKSFSPHSHPVGSLCWSPNNQCLASAANDKVVVTYVKGDVYDITEIGAGEGNTCVAFNSSSRYLLTGGKAKTLNIWDMKTKSIKKTYKDHKDVVSCLTFNWNDTSIASGSVNGDILLHNVISGQASDPLRLVKTQAVRDIQFSHFKKSLLGAVSDDSALNLWDSNTRKLFTSFTSDHKAPATGLSFSPMNDMLLCSVGLDKRIVFYDVQGRKSVKVMTAESPLTSVDFMSDGATLAVGSTRGKIYIYDLRSGSTPVNTTVAHKTSVQSLSFHSATKVNSLTNSKSTKPSSVVNSKPQKPPEPLVNTPNPQPSSPITKTDQKLLTNTPTLKQNGVKDDEEDIFSPLREIKTPLINNKQVNTTASYNLKESNPPEVSGVFSPIGSNLSGTSNQQPMHPTRGSPATANSNAAADTQRTTDQLAAVTGNTVSPLKNARSSATRSLTELGTARDQAYESLPKSYSDTKLITNKNPSNGIISENFGSNRDLHPSPADSLLANVQRNMNEDIRPVSNSTLPHTEGRRPSKEFSSPHGSPSSIRRLAEGTEIANYMYTADRPELHSVSPAQSLIFDSVKQRTDPSASGAVGLAASQDNAPDMAGAAANSAGMLPFQVQFIKNLIDESLDEFRVAIHREIVNVQVEMLRQFQIQQNELKGLIEKYSVNEALVLEIERLKEENNRLKSKY